VCSVAGAGRRRALAALLGERPGARGRTVVLGAAGLLLVLGVTVAASAIV
jgi:hypothetical protein